MDFPRNQTDARWMDELERTEHALMPLGYAIPPGQLREYTDDLALWGKRVGNDILAANIRRMRADGMTQTDICHVLKLSVRRYQTLMGISKGDARKRDIPSHYEDISERFAQLFRQG